MKKIHHQTLRMAVSIFAILFALQPAFVATSAYATDIPVSYTETIETSVITETNLIEPEATAETNTNITDTELPAEMNTEASADTSVNPTNADLIATTEENAESKENEELIQEESTETTEEDVEEKLWERIDETTAKTIGPVEIGTKYVFPFNILTTITFTSLPENPAPVTMRQITLTSEQQELVGTKEAIAYEITTDMLNGSFEYSLTLPKSSGDIVKYAKDIDSLAEVREVESSVIDHGNKIEIVSLDHFTIFVVTNPNPAPPTNVAENVLDNSDGPSVYSETGTWINSACLGYPTASYPSDLTPAGVTRYIENNNTDTATWEFTVPTTGTYQVYASWGSHANRTTTAQYTINSDIGSENVVVDQSSGVASCGWSGFNSIGGLQTFTAGITYNVSLINLDSSSVVSADAIKVQSVSAPADVWVDDDWAGSSLGDEVSPGLYFGHNAFSTIQEGLDNVLEGAPGDLSRVNINNGTYAECPRLIGKSYVDVLGQNRNNTVIDGSSCPSYVFQIGNGGTDANPRVNNILIRRFTLVGNTDPSASYGFKVEGVDTLRMRNITARDAYRSQVDLHSVNGGFITNVSASNAGFGVGIALTQVNNFNVSDVTTSGNAWAGMALYSNGAYYPPEGSDSVTYSGTITMDEILGLYLQSAGDPTTITNVLIAPGTDFSATTSNYIISLAAQNGGNDIEALEVNWGTEVLNDIEERIQHDCADSPFGTANTCNGDDLAASFPSVNYIGNGVQGLVYRDVNLNGDFDSSDPRNLTNRYTNWTVNLYDTSGTLIETTTTQDPSGLYSFINLTDGDYLVCADNPADFTQTEPSSGPVGFENCHSFSVSDNRFVKGRQFGFIESGELHLKKFICEEASFDANIGELNVRPDEFGVVNGVAFDDLDSSSFDGCILSPEPYYFDVYSKFDDGALDGNVSNYDLISETDPDPLGVTGEYTFSNIPSTSRLLVREMSDAGSDTLIDDTEVLGFACYSAPDPNSTSSLANSQANATMNSNNETFCVSFNEVDSINQPPQVEINSPLDGEIVSGNVDFTASISDETFFRFDYKLFAGTDTTATPLIDGPTTGSSPFDQTTFTNQVITSIDTTALPDGEYTFTVGARDEFGLRDDANGSYDEITFTVVNLTAPTYLGWNVQGQDAADANPATLSCNEFIDGTTGIGVSGVWSEVTSSYGTVRYIRHNVRPNGNPDLLLWQNGGGQSVSTVDGALLDDPATLAATLESVAGGAYSNTFTGFGSFGAGEGTYEIRVIAFVDLNNNGLFEASEPLSDWSNYCNITNQPTPEPSSVEVCKVDSENTPLANWNFSVAPMNGSLVDTQNEQTGTTDETGCVTIENIPASSDGYYISEDLFSQEGIWQNTAIQSVSGVDTTPLCEFIPDSTSCFGNITLTDLDVDQVVFVNEELDITIDKAAPTSVTRGASFTYSITVANNSNISVSYVSVYDSIPENLSIVSMPATSSDYLCSSFDNGTNEEVTCDIYNLEANTTYTIDILVTTNTLGTYENEACLNLSYYDVILCDTAVTTVTTPVATPTPQPEPEPEPEVGEPTLGLTGFTFTEAQLNQVAAGLNANTICDNDSATENLPCDDLVWEARRPGVTTWTQIYRGALGTVSFPINEQNANALVQRYDYGNIFTDFFIDDPINPEIRVRFADNQYTNTANAFVQIENRNPVASLTVSGNGATVSHTTGETVPTITVNAGQVVSFTASFTDPAGEYDAGPGWDGRFNYGGTGFISQSVSQTDNTTYAVSIPAQTYAAGTYAASLRICEEDNLYGFCSIAAVNIQVIGQATNPGETPNPGSIGTPEQPEGDILGGQEQALDEGDTTDAEIDPNEGDVLGDEDSADEESIEAFTCEDTTLLSGFVYVQENENGIKDENEDALENATITAFFINEEGEREEAASTTSNTEGYWELELCPARYEIEIDGESVDGSVLDSETRTVIVDEQDIDNTNFEVKADSSSDINPLLIIVPVALVALAGAGYVATRGSKE